jgi:hypothetical protein
VKLTSRGRFVVGTLVLVALWVWIIASFTVGQAWKQDRLNTEDSGTIAPLDITCQEDMPCWDCTSMGNKECGP